MKWAEGLPALRPFRIIEGPGPRPRGPRLRRPGGDAERARRAAAARSVGLLSEEGLRGELAALVELVQVQRAAAARAAQRAHASQLLPLAALGASVEQRGIAAVPLGGTAGPATQHAQHVGDL